MFGNDSYNDNDNYNNDDILKTYGTRYEHLLTQNRKLHSNSSVSDGNGNGGGSGSDSGSGSAD